MDNTAKDNSTKDSNRDIAEQISRQVGFVRVALDTLLASQRRWERAVLGVGDFAVTSNVLEQHLLLPNFHPFGIDDSLVAVDAVNQSQAVNQNKNELSRGQQPMEVIPWRPSTTTDKTTSAGLREKRQQVQTKRHLPLGGSSPNVWPKKDYLSKSNSTAEVASDVGQQKAMTHLETLLNDIAAFSDDKFKPEIRRESQRQPIGSISASFTPGKLPTLTSYSKTSYSKTSYSKTRDSKETPSTTVQASKPSAELSAMLGTLSTLVTALSKRPNSTGDKPVTRRMHTDKKQISPLLEELTRSVSGSRTAPQFSDNGVAFKNQGASPSRDQQNSTNATRSSGNSAKPEGVQAPTPVENVANTFFPVNTKPALFRSPLSPAQESLIEPPLFGPNPLRGYEIADALNEYLQEQAILHGVDLT